MNIPRSLYTIFSRHLSSTPNFRKIPSKYRPLAIKEAQQVVTDYLHHTRSIPFTYAEQISKNSLCTLSNLIANVDGAYSVPTFAGSVQRFLRYHPINEFEFFYESIGIDYSEVRGFLPANKFFFSEDGSVLNAACAFSGFGFPWNRLGRLYKEEVSIFGKSTEELTSRLCKIRDRYGFNNVTVVAVCLAFPCVLGGEGELGGEIGALFDDLKMVFVDFDLVSCVEGNVDAFYEICRKIRLFYDLGCEKGKFGDVMGKNKSLFVDYKEEALVQKAEYFCSFGVRKEEVAMLLLQGPDILSFDLDTRVISVEGMLSHFGLSANELKSVAEKYPFVLGKNKMANLPHVMRALNLQEWFFNRISNGNHRLLGNYVLSNPDERLDKEYQDSLERFLSLKLRVHTMNKLEFLHGIGYGENALTIKVLAHVQGTSSELQERFDCLLRNGIEFSKLCRMISLAPKVLKQKPEIIDQKVNFLCEEIGASLDSLDAFPAFLCFDLEHRIKPRYRFHTWLNEKGLCTKDYSIASMVATSEKKFIARIFRIHPAAPKQWLERFMSKRPSSSSRC
ncbi:hypothetical protein JRO89_XS12G0247000 [Xanthoceras sorbifolium]|uniref:Transcription termination factor MTEF18, mitochondrial n=1 Tax=Xanthoceras sorbifolium TaxID=99658 RepID=A0ABQ8HDR4_9ROSI|nr:hypothetical protein JRO89_XS12G0247000 [Xanthoceras sorbifolium]